MCVELLEDALLVFANGLTEDQHQKINRTLTEEVNKTLTCLEYADRKQLDKLFTEYHFSCGLFVFLVN